MNVPLAAVLLLAATGVEPEAARLAGLARVWGQVKYVHPAMASSQIDWDAALIRAIPAVENAASDEAYRVAIDRLLAELRDPVTRVIRQGRADDAPVPESAPPSVRLETIDAKTAVVTIPNDPALEATPHLQSEICDRFTEAARFEGVVVDLRSHAGRRPGWGLKNAIVKCASRLLDRDITLAPARFLTHGFYMMQSVNGGAGGGRGLGHPASR